MTAFNLTAELTRIRADVASILPETACVISRLTEASDGQGGMTQTWAAVGTANARIVANSGNTRGVAAQTNTVGNYTLTVPHDTSIQETDRVTIDTVVYRCVFVDDVKDWKTAIRCQLNLEVS